MVNKETMSSSQLAKMLGYEKKEINKKIRSMFAVKIEGEEISLTTRENGQVIDYYLPELESKMFVAKHDIDYLELITKYWIDKGKVKEEFQIPQTLGDALQLAADQAKQLELQAPKVAFVDNCVERGQLMTATQVAQKHKLSAKALNKFLDELGGVYSKSIKRSRVFVQPFINKELGEMKQTEQGYSQALFTAKGEQWVNEKLINEGVI
jgi:phage antirepressor YoqD-like protein